MTDIDYSILEKGFRVTHNEYVDYYYAMSVDCNDNGDYQFCTKEFKDTAERLVNFLNTLLDDKKRVEKENEQLKKQLNAFKPIIFEDVNTGGSDILYEKVEE